jgi:hypothetical protein
LAQINDALIGNVNYQGLWNAATNTPTLVNPPSSGTKGYYYIVSTAGTFAGISFEVGDWIISNGSAWQKVDNTDAVSSVFGRTGNVIAANGDYNTSQVTENTNLYFTNARVLATALTGYTLGTNTALADTDTILGAFGKVQGQLNAKQNTLTNPVTGTGTNNYLPKFTGTTTIGNSLIQTDVSGNLMVGSADAGDAGSINVSVGIAGSTSGGLQLWSNDLATHYIQFGDGTTGDQKYAGYVGYSHSTNAMVFGTDSGNKMRIFSDGNVSISNFPSNAGYKLDVNGTGRFFGNLTAASFIRSGGTSSQFLKADGSVDSNTYVTGGPYLPLTGGTLTGTLNGTTAVFSNTVTGYQGIFKDGSEGLIIGYYTGGNGYGAIYASSLTINNSNYALIAKSDNTILNAPTGGSVNVSIGNTPRLTIASTGAATFSSSVTITDGGYYIYDTRTNLANRNWVLVSNAQFFGDFAIRQSNAKDGNPLTAGTDRFYIGPTGAATFSSSVTATSIIRSGGTSSQYLMADGSVSTLTNPVTGTGTTNYLPKFTGTSTIGNSIVSDNGSRILINTGTTNQNTTINASKIAMSRTSDGAEVVYFSKNTDLGSEGTANIHGYDGIQFRTQGAETVKATLNASGNLGLGVTPSAWGTSFKAIQVGYAAVLWGTNSSNEFYVGNNYYVSSTGRRYLNNGFATEYFQFNGEHSWQTAPSGTAGNAISFTQAMTLFASGNLAVGPTTDNGARLQLNGNVTISNSGTVTSTITSTTNTGVALYTTVNNVGSTTEIGTWGSTRTGFGAIQPNNGYIYSGVDLAIGSGTNLKFSTGGSNLTRLTIDSTGAATFSSSVTAAGIVNNGGFRLKESTASTSSRNWIIGNDWQVFGDLGIGQSTTQTGGVYSFPLYINPSGNVGIGTTTDAGFKLDVNGTGRFSGAGNALRLNSTSNDVWQTFIPQSGNTWRIQATTGNVFGIYNENSAFFPLTIASTGAATFSSSVTATALTLTSTDSVIATNTSDGTDNKSINISGGGTQSIARGANLRLYGNEYTGEVGNAYLFSGNVANSNIVLNAYSSSSTIQFLSNNTERMRITSGGNVLIGTTSDNGSRLRVNGSVALPHVTKSANYTLDATDYTVGFDCASNRTATLPDATTCAGRVYVIYQYNTGTGGSRYVTLDGNGSQTIDGVTTYSLQYQEDFSSVMIQSTGSNWVVIAYKLYPSPL